MSVLDPIKTQVTAVPHVLGERCMACRTCVARRVCKSEAIVRVDPGEPSFIDASRCYACHLCVPACPHHAITVGARSRS